MYKEAAGIHPDSVRATDRDNSTCMRRHQPRVHTGQLNFGQLKFEIKFEKWKRW